MQRNTIASAFFTALFIAGCSSASDQKVSVKDSELSGCLVGAFCELVGMLNIYRGTTLIGVLESAENSITLALEKKLYKDQDQWDQKRVLISGLANRIRNTVISEN